MRMSAEFADTNVVLYLLDDGPKADRAEDILGQGIRLIVILARQDDLLRLTDRAAEEIARSRLDLDEDDLAPTLDDQIELAAAALRQHHAGPGLDLQGAVDLEGAVGVNIQVDYRQRQGGGTGLKTTQFIRQFQFDVVKPQIRCNFTI